MEDLQRRMPAEPAGLPALRAQAAQPAGGLGELAVQVDGPPVRLAHRAGHELPATRTTLRAAVDFVSQFDASPARSFQALEHVRVARGPGAVVVPVYAEPGRRLPGGA